jgi:hypothetical protein
MLNIATELTRSATAVITIAPRAALILADPSFKQMVHVAADAPERSAKTTADVGTVTSFDGSAANVGPVFQDFAFFAKVATCQTC